MEKITNHFSLDANKFAKLLYDTNSFISGGSALCAFLNKNIQNDQDLDIFLRVPHDRHKRYAHHSYYPYQELATEKIVDFLKSQGYNNNGPSGSGDSVYGSMKEETNGSHLSSHVKYVINYYNNDKKIQLIILYDCRIEEFLNSYDLNVCRLAICANNDEYEFPLGNTPKMYFYHKLCKYITKKELDDITNKKMYILKSNFDNSVDRIKKYIKRGFTLIEINDSQDSKFDDYVKNNLLFLSLYCSKNV